ncbi:ABC transporter permease [Ureibacillus acetophenoni]|uniref:Acetoin utilization transport system permease protein n=1 Tax=Ureibacillus acetophenoni TaxID=614649 RepID=A0A285U1M0_9BACL|nr:FtsX-like permease family protein [Ureibacillus acetophenoni]SOC35633.1 acetoin utilization transport system permease protein [Ureibacillus acetophenoni]
MLFKDQLSFVFQHMRKNKLRVTMTVLAAMIGCAFLIVLASVGFGLQATIKGEILNQEDITEINLWGDEPLTQEEMVDIEEIDHVNVVLTRNEISGSIRSTFEDREVESMGIAVNMEDQAKLPSTLSEGRLPENANEIAVGYHFARALLNDKDREIIEQKSKEAEEQGTWYDGLEEGYKGEILNKQVNVQFMDPETMEYLEQISTYTIVGILDEPDYEFQIDSSILFSDDLFLAQPNLVSYPATTIYVDTLDNVLPVLDQLRESNYQVYSPIEQVKELDLFFLIFKIGLIFIGTISILIASIGIFNTMTMAVTERTREIGVLKAIGASPNIIQRLFLMESAFIGLLGTALAVIVSYGLSYLINALLPSIVAFALSDENADMAGITFSIIPVSLVLIAGGISIFVAILSGWRPARKATKIEVIQALRQEL